jgi:hypothetical protein|uniref:Uncharacterized protein n=1 Tax=Picea glauca TaxID=3330 RepID=A0A117NGR5_PICGL|nr:hypothetical protein ABT39_MTgene6204 [Picea glauca]QHR88726.1 hypothetical protein Q903MT_gene2740 [Picea sitchensis]
MQESLFCALTIRCAENNIHQQKLVVKTKISTTSSIDTCTSSPTQQQPAGNYLLGTQTKAKENTNQTQGQKHFLFRLSTRPPAFHQVIYPAFNHFPMIE